MDDRGYGTCCSLLQEGAPLTLTSQALLCKLIAGEVEGMGGACSRGNDPNAPEEGTKMLLSQNALEGLQHALVSGHGVRSQSHHTSLQWEREGGKENLWGLNHNIGTLSTTRLQSVCGLP